MFDVSPNVICLGGRDLFGDSAYEITATLERENSAVSIAELIIKAYGKVSKIDVSYLKQVRNPDFTSVSVVNEVGVRGSYFYIYLPFGDSVSHKAIHRTKDKKALVIHTESDGTVGTVKIFDPEAKEH
jgi:hypothetical protein